MTIDNIPIDEREIDPIDEADRRARLECKGLQWWTIHRDVKIRHIRKENDNRTS
jgi:hypothetical protein